MSGRPQHHDRGYLRHDQYRDDRNLAARADIYRRFGTNTQSWNAWVFAQLALQPGESVLECGCGPGWLWAENADAVPPATRLSLTDLSIGMVATASAKLRRLPLTADFIAADIARLPFFAAQFDLVIANHMLYHVPDRRQALAEVARVLEPNGRFVAATNGFGHLEQLERLVRAVFPDTEREKYFWSADFSLENGAEQLKAFFGHVELREYRDVLHIDDAQAVIAYLGSTSTQRANLTAERATRVQSLVEEEIARQGAFQVTTASGLYLARLRA